MARCSRGTTLPLPGPTSTRPMAAPDPLESLREAVELSPQNLPLRRHYARSLLAAERGPQAESEFRAILKLDPADIDASLGLAETFLLQGETTSAIVVLEVVESGDRPDKVAEAQLLLAQASHDRRELDLAHDYYRKAIQSRPELANAALAKRIGYAEYREVRSFKFEYDGDNESDNSDPFGSPSDDSPFGSDDSPALVTSEQTFDDVGGMDAVKEQIRLKVLYPQQHRELYEAYGKKAGGGVLLYGPPGCGKTHIARATAGEMKAGILAVGLNDVLSMWLGDSEDRLHRLFKTARSQTPSVLFFDEVDALAARRSQMSGGAGRNVINQFLAELDGVRDDNDGVLILAATNAPWHLDPAFRRPGRFGEILFVPPPYQPAREAIFRIVLKGKPTDELDYSKLARKTDRFSGADIREVCDQAIETKLAAAMKSGQLAPIETRDLLAAIKRHKPTTADWFASARNHALYANEGGLYDDVLDYLKLR